MTQEEAKKKYGDTKVMVIKADTFKEIYNKYAGEYPEDLIHIIDENMNPMLRWEAEFDASYLQVIPYVVIMARHDAHPFGNVDVRYFATHRIEGDSRLVGQYSIGTGGHIDEGEGILEGLVRELKEEVGLDVTGKILDLNLPDDDVYVTMPLYTNEAFIYDPSNDVSSVHLGIIFYCIVPEDQMSNVSIMEPEKLAGQWVSSGSLIGIMSTSKLETWSCDVVERLVNSGATECW